MLVDVGLVIHRLDSSVLSIEMRGEVAVLGTPA